LINSSGEILLSSTSGLKTQDCVSPSVDGAANEALLKLLAERLNLPKSALHIVHGATGRQKVLQIEGLTAEELAQKLLNS